MFLLHSSEKEYNILQQCDKYWWNVIMPTENRICFLIKVLNWFRNICITAIWE